MEQPLMEHMKIPTTGSKREYLQQMKETRELQARQLDIRTKEMHAYMRGTELKEEEEELREREEALKKREEELAIRKREF
jgi:uncharacterized protein (DUF3084 family)